MFVPAPAAGSVSNGQWQYIKILRTGNVAVLTDNRGTQLAIAEFGKVLSTECEMYFVNVVADFYIFSEKITGGFGYMYVYIMKKFFHVM